MILRANLRGNGDIVEEMPPTISVKSAVKASFSTDVRMETNTPSPRQKANRCRRQTQPVADGSKRALTRESISASELLPVLNPSMANRSQWLLGDDCRSARD